MSNLKTLRKTQDFIDAGYLTESQKVEINAVGETFSFSMTSAMQKQVKKKCATDPVVMQFLPSREELTVLEEELEDPIGDEFHSKIKGIVHRYPDRCLLKPVNVCPVYCRFCFRREKIGAGSEVLKPEELQAAFQYIREHKEIWEVILTGGEPLMLKPSQLSDILQALDQINHVEVVRLHTRIPSVDPERINDSMIKALKLKNKPTYLVIHINHPNEFSPHVERACAALADAGIPLLGQSVLLKSLNDNIETLGQLMRLFVKNRIKPYYLHQADLVRGTSHFRTTIDVGQKLMKELRGNYSGLCQPTYVLDIPGGYGKIPINYNYINEKSESYSVEDYRGNVYSYKMKIEK